MQFLHSMLLVKNERETSKLKEGGTGMFVYEVEGHMQKLNSYGQGKKKLSKKSLTLFMHSPLQL